jgi:hypothetical protein
VYPYLVHSVGWPLPRHYHPELSLEPAKKFDHASVRWLSYELTPEQLEKKHEAILKYRSQTASHAFYLLAFARKNELYGDFPEVALTRPRREASQAAPARLSLLDKAREFFGISELFSSRKQEEETEETISQEEPAPQVRGRVSYALENGDLLIKIEKNAETNIHFGTQAYLFGYRRETPFAQMPKIRILTKHKKVRVFDGARQVPVSGVEIALGAHVAVLRVPLRTLGDPEFVLASMKCYNGGTPADVIGFRKIVLQGGQNG